MDRPPNWIACAGRSPEPACLPARHAATCSAPAAPACLPKRPGALGRLRRLTHLLLRPCPFLLQIDAPLLTFPAPASGQQQQQAAPPQQQQQQAAQRAQQQGGSSAASTSHAAPPPGQPDSAQQQQQQQQREQQQRERQRQARRPRVTRLCADTHPVVAGFQDGQLAFWRWKR